MEQRVEIESQTETDEFEFDSRVEEFLMSAALTSSDRI